MAGFVEVTGNAYPQPRVIYVQPVGEPRYNFLSRVKKETPNATKAQSLVHHDLTGKNLFMAEDGQAQITDMRTEFADIVMPDCCGEMVMENTSETTEEDEEELSEPASASSLKKISWIWPELGRRNAICEEIEKTLIDEGVNLNQLRERLKVKIMKGKFLSRNPHKVEPKGE